MQYAFQMSQQAANYGMQRNINVNEMMIRPLFGNMAIIAVFMIPMITMRLIAEEKKTGTLELLMTSPITPLQWILGKYFSGFVLFGTMISFAFIPVFLLFLFGNPEFWPIITGYVGLLLLGGAFISLGLLISSFTENQIISAAVSFFIFLFLWVIDWIADSLGYALGSVVKYLSIVSHFDDFSKGVVDISSIIFFLSFIIFGIFLTYRSIDSIRWRM
jgi:ABC-2 type transport system permease protein